jgi:hypothetical protein
MNYNGLAMILSGKGTEMFVNNDEALFATSRQILSVDQVPAHIKDLLIDHISSTPGRKAAYVALSGSDDQDAIIGQYVKCMSPNLDGTPDIDEDGRIHETEYNKCPNRNTCPHVGVGCNKFASVNGNKISSGEVSILSMCHYSDKEIAEQLFLSPMTVGTHLQNIRKKLNASSTKMLVSIAASNGILNQDNIWSY